MRSSCILLALCAASLDLATAKHKKGNKVQGALVATGLDCKKDPNQVVNMTSLTSPFSLIARDAYKTSNHDMAVGVNTVSWPYNGTAALVLSSTKTTDNFKFDNGSLTYNGKPCNLNLGAGSYISCYTTGQGVDADNDGYDGPNFDPSGFDIDYPSGSWVLQKRCLFKKPVYMLYPTVAGGSDSLGEMSATRIIASGPGTSPYYKDHLYICALADFPCFESANSGLRSRDVLLVLGK